MTRNLLVTLFISILSLTLSAQVKNDIRFEHLTKANGLPSNSVVCIFKDSRGFMWFGTESEGLCRFDGNHFKIYKHDSTIKNSIPGNFITNIMEDHEGKLWISCFDQGVTRFDPVLEKFNNYKHDSTNIKTFSQGYANGGLIDSKGRVWIGTWGGGINLYDPKIDGFIHIRYKKDDTTALCSDQTKDLKQDASGWIWISTWHEGGGDKRLVQKIDPETRKIVTLKCTEMFNPDGSKCDHFYGGLGLMHKVYVARNQDIWFATYVGVFRYDQKKKAFYQYVSTGNDSNAISFNNVRSIVEDNDGNIWLGSLGGGLNRYNPSTGKFSVYVYDYNNANSISDNLIRGMYKDEDGRIWIGTFTGGVNILNPFKQAFKLITNEKLKATFVNKSAGNIINGICSDDQGRLIVNSGSGFSVFDVKENKLLKMIPKKENAGSGCMLNIPGKGVLAASWANTYFVFPDKGTTSGFFDERTEKSKHFYNPNRLMRSKNGKVWYLNDRFTIDILDPITEHGEPFLPGGQELKETRYMEEDYPGKLFFACRNTGLAELDLASNKLTRFKNDSTPGCLLSDQMSFVMYDDNKNLWVGTMEGLQLFHPETGKFSLPPGCEAIAKQPVFDCIKRANGNLWFTTPNAIWCYTTEGKLVKFDSRLGMYAREFIEMPMNVSVDGKIYVASSDGVIYFDPELIKIPSSRPKMFLNDVRLHNNELNSDTAHFALHNLSLPDYQNSFTFEFSSNDLTSRESVKYSYMLEGYDQNWIDSSQNTSATYTNLPPGDYIFRARAKNIFGIESSNEIALSIHISPPFWMRWWFFVLVVISAIGSVIGFIRWRVGALRRKNDKLEAVITERTAEVVSQKEIIEQKNKEVTDSIHYAKTIQEAILPTENFFKEHFPKSFILFKPKDIVSGDFYWVSKHDDILYYATVDCTGHGVPGGFMSMLGSSLLNDIVDESNITHPADVLYHMRERIIVSLKQSLEFGDNKDGMDMSFCKVDLKKMLLTYSGANNGLYIVRNNEIQEHKGTKQPIGIYMGERKDFEQFEVPLQKGDIIYSYTDGYADQFGGDKGKKFKWANLEKLLLSNSNKTMEEQKNELDNVFETWKAHHEQIDDVLLIGICT